jgi:hypothetical protein
MFFDFVRLEWSKTFQPRREGFQPFSPYNLKVPRQYRG